jgi:hypothetical protein
MIRGRPALLVTLVLAWSLCPVCVVLSTYFSAAEFAAPSSLRPVRVTAADPLPVTARGAEQFDRILQRIETPPEAGIAVLSHLLRLRDAYSPPDRRSCLPPGDCNPRSERDAIVERLLPRAPREAESSEFFEFTESGCRYRIASRRTEAGEQHPGQALSALAEAGVPLVQTAYSGVRSFCVSDLVDECAQSFAFDEEIEWRSVALALYQPEVNEWKNRRGEVISFDAITNELLRRTRIRGSIEHACWGIHSLYALAVLLSVDADVPLWQNRSLRPQVEAALAAIGDRLARSQLGDGSWDEHWELPALTHGGTTMDEQKRLLITGHHLEWLALVPNGLRPSKRVLLAAGEFILGKVSELRPDQIIEEICPCSHGLRAFGIAGTQVIDRP